MAFAGVELARPRLLSQPVPSFAAGYATSAGEATGREFWRGLKLLYAPFLGPTGNRLVNFVDRHNDITATGFTLSDAWEPTAGGWSINTQGDGTKYLLLDTAVAPLTATISLLFSFYDVSATIQVIVGRNLVNHEPLRVDSPASAAGQFAWNSGSGDKSQVHGGFNKGQLTQVTITNGDAVRWYRDGVHLGTSAAETGRSRVTRISGRVDESLPAYINLHAFYMWDDRQLTAGEVKRLWEDPYALLRLQRRRIFKAPVVADEGLTWQSSEVHLPHEERIRVVSY